MQVREHLQSRNARAKAAREQLAINDIGVRSVSVFPACKLTAGQTVARMRKQKDNAVELAPLRINDACQESAPVRAGSYEDLLDTMQSPEHSRNILLCLAACQVSRLSANEECSNCNLGMT